MNINYFYSITSNIKQYSFYLYFFIQILLKNIKKHWKYMIYAKNYVFCIISRYFYSFYTLIFFILFFLFSTTKKRVCFVPSLLSFYFFVGLYFLDCAEWKHLFLFIYSSKFEFDFFLLRIIETTLCSVRWTLYSLQGVRWILY